MVDKPAKVISSAYSSIPHLPGSRLGSGDHHISEGQSRFCTEKCPPNYNIIATTKLDGACVAAYKTESGEIIALGRAGYRASDSQWEHIQLWHNYVEANQHRFDTLLNPGERAVGEWIALAHSTLYFNVEDPFYLFDIMTGVHRLPWSKLLDRNDELWGKEGSFQIPDAIAGPIDPQDAIEELDAHDAYMPEGVVYRGEARGKKNGKEYHRVMFMAKYVLHDKVDGLYLGSDDEVWNWHPTKLRHMRVKSGS